MKSRSHLLGHLLILLLVLQARSQVTKIDSLRNELKHTADDISKSKIFSELGFYYTNLAPDSAKFYCKKAILKGGDKQAIADAYRYLTQVFVNQGQYDSALNFAIYAHKGYSEINDLVGRAEVLNLFAIIFMNQGIYDSAIFFSSRSLREFELQGDKRGQASAYNILGNIAQRRGNYPLASQHLHNALTINQETGDKQGEADVLNNIGVIYEYLEQYDEALTNYNSFYQLYKELDDKLGVAIGLHNAGIILKKTGNLDSAIYNFNQALLIDESIKSLDGVAYDLKELGETYFLKDSFQRAFTCFHRSLKIASSFQDPVVIVPAYIGLGKIHLREGSYDSARYYLELAINKASQSGLDNEVKAASKSLYELFDKLKDIEKAFFYYLKYAQIKDELFSEDNIRKLAIIEAEHKFQQERREQEVQMTLNELKRDREVARAVWIRNTSIAGAIIVLFLSFFIYKNYKKKRIANEKLNNLYEELIAANEEISEMNTSLEDKIKERTRLLEKKNEKLKKYMYSNSHMVRAPLARILGLVELYQDHSDNGHDPGFVTQNIYKSAKELDDVLRGINNVLSEEDD